MSAAQLPVDGHVLTVLRTYAELAAFEREFGGKRFAEAEDGTPSAAELDGTACIRCGAEFATDDANRPVGPGPRGQLFAHTDTAVCDAEERAL